MNTRKIVVLVFILLQASCASVGSVNIEDSITERVKARWHALINHNWEDAYQYETKGYRVSHTLEQYQSSFGRAVIWKSVEIANVQLNESQSTAKVKVIVPYETHIPGFGLQHSISSITETWILDAEKWWHYID